LNTFLGTLFAVYYKTYVIDHRPHPGKEVGMKRILWFYLAVVLLVPSYSMAGVIGPARVSLVVGDVLFQTPDSGEWLPVAINTPLDEGDALWCPEGSKAEVQLPDGSLVRLDEGSQLDLLANEDSFMHLHLASGRLYLKTPSTGTPNYLQIDADDTTVLPAARTRLRLDMLPNSQEDVSLFKGTAYVEGNGSRTKVRAGEHIALEEGHSELLPLNPPDSWEEWNMVQDRARSRAAGAESYLPDELQSYSSELDANGSWVTVPEYGRVWRPTVLITDDWAPYRSGRWVWNGNDYVWVSYESWGWAPYHYGRWAVINSIGWCWVPPTLGDVFWGPGYVGWYRTGSHIGWTPLAPGEIFYGRGQYGRHSVNIATTTVSIRSVEYRNRQARGGLTVLPQDDFLRGRAATSRSAGNAAVSVSVGSPRLQPVRETRMPIVRQSIPKFVSPRAEHRDIGELRQRFPRLTPESGSRPQLRQPVPATAGPASFGQTPPGRDIRPVSPSVPAQSQPAAAAPQRREQPQRSGTPVVTPQAVTPQRGAIPRQVPVQRGQKKVWKVTTPENGKERVPRVNEPKERERKER
jgi:hypothetical protein